ncbi:HesA/MoeB/ThiF family protein [Albidovulum sp.]|uniref:HesA/MoeB/ThiF family protein n=1 Tax=Albidovulum sp. TaxID=1872424 RepID=UPI001D9E245A|nr:molybdopterin-synthase adenylyltransferase MoeB [Paracoccaceae bacterium]
MIVLLAAVLVVALGGLFDLPVRRVALMLMLLWAVALLGHLLLPEGHALLRLIGGSARGWGALGVAALIAAVYAGGVAFLRRRARGAPAPVGAGPMTQGREPQETAMAGPFSAAELDRYARHIVLREIGGTGQRRLKEARVLVVGAGGLGSPALLYLAAAGVGTIGVIDDDTVSSSNLQRQVIHRDDSIGMEKVFSAEAAMRALNPHVGIRPYNRRLVAEEAPALFADYDLILDGSDNLDTRYLVNAAAVSARRPLISAAITQWEGQISLYDPARGAPCYACIFPERPAAGLAPSCAEAGVMGALPGVMGAMMAVEAIKEIAGAGEGLRGRLLIYDALYAESRQITLRRSPGCAVCGG